MKVNMNNTCKVELTEYGSAVIKKYVDRMYTANLIATFYKSRFDEENRFTTSLWDLMNIFGDSIYLGGETPFKDNVIEIIEGT